MLLGMPKRTLIIAAALVGLGLLVVTGGAERMLSGVAPEACKFTVTADALNLRAAPSTAAPSVGQAGAGDEVSGSPVVQNGFRMLSEARWASDEFLDQREGSVCT